MPMRKSTSVEQHRSGGDLDSDCECLNTETSPYRATDVFMEDALLAHGSKKAAKIISLFHVDLSLNLPVR